MAQNWIHIEDDPDIIDAEIDEALDDLEKPELMEGRHSDDEVDFGESNVLMVGDNTDAPPAMITFLEAEQYLQVLKQYSRSIKLPANEAAMLDRYGRSLRAHRLAMPKSSPTLLSFFAPLSKKPDPSAPNDLELSAPPLRGLKNMGHTCYLSASLQMLFSCFDFMNALHATTYNHDSPLTSAVCFTHSELKNRVCSIPVVPRSIKEAIDYTAKEKFADGMQHDAHECLTHVLDRIDDELKRAPDENDGRLPTDAFCTVIQQHLTCKNCGYSR